MVDRNLQAIIKVLVKLLIRNCLPQFSIQNPTLILQPGNKLQERASVKLIGIQNVKL